MDWRKRRLAYISRQIRRFKFTATSSGTLTVDGSFRTLFQPREPNFFSAKLGTGCGAATVSNRIQEDDCIPPRLGAGKPAPRDDNCVAGEADEKYRLPHISQFRPAKQSPPFQFI
jgi:hypothetical protein